MIAATFCNVFLRYDYLCYEAWVFGDWFSAQPEKLFNIALR